MTTYQRKIDNGFGHQTIIVDNGIIIQQYIGARVGSHSYTGDGNPEFVGCDKKVLRGKNFKKLRGSAHENIIENYFNSLT
jgi:hypothetical protein